MYNTDQWLMFFFIYCFLGWVWETLYVSAKSGEWVNRGFLHGPFLPIYGTGAVVVLLSTIEVRDNLLLVYIFGMIGATILEYFTGTAMEKLFGVRYWDYSGKKFNLNGHICLSVSIAWGFFSILMVRVIHPPLEQFVMDIPLTATNVMTLILTVILAVDTTVSVNEALDLKETLKKLAESNEEIRKLQNRVDFVYALAEDDLHKFIEESEEKKEKFKDRVEANLASARERRLAWLDNLAEEAMTYFENMEEQQEKIQSYLEQVEKQRNKLRERTNRDYLRSSRILRRNPGAISNHYKDELAEILKLLKK